MIISTDSTANLPKKLYKEYNISSIPMQIVLNNRVYNDLSQDLPLNKFYKQMQEGATPTTAQINEYSAKEYFEKLLEQKEDILHISFSSGMSGTFSTIKKVANELNAINKNKIVLIDSLNASMGEGLLVLKACELKQAGRTINEIKNELTSYIPKVKSYFTVDQLKYLVRGGRVSKFSGTIGKILNIKPILCVDKNGKLISCKKVITRKKSLLTLAQICKEKIGTNKTIYITHAECENDALTLATEIENSIGIKPIITDLTQVIGCHTGPGLVAIFFFEK